jgi:hypothetical protein
MGNICNIFSNVRLQSSFRRIISACSNKWGSTLQLTFRRENSRTHVYVTFFPPYPDGTREARWESVTRSTQCKNQDPCRGHRRVHLLTIFFSYALVSFTSAIRARSPHPRDVKKERWPELVGINSAVTLTSIYRQRKGYTSCLGFYAHAWWILSNREQRVHVARLRRGGAYFFFAGKKKKNRAPTLEVGYRAWREEKPQRTRLTRLRHPPKKTPSTAICAPIPFTTRPRPRKPRGRINNYFLPVRYAI